MKTKTPSLRKILAAAIGLSAAGIGNGMAQTTISYANPAVLQETAVSSTSGSANITVSNGANYAVGDVINFYGTTVTTNPFGTTSTNYYVTSVSGNTIQVSTTPGGTALNASNTTTVSTTRLGQGLLTGSNWTGGTAPNNNSTIANFGNTAASIPAYVINGGNQTVYGLTFNGGGSSDISLVSGANGTGYNQLIFATNDSTTPKVTLNGGTRTYTFGSGTGALKLAVGGTQGLIFNSVAGGTLTGSGVTATSTNAGKDTRLQNIDWSNFSGGITVERGEVRLNAATAVLPNQTLTIGNNQTVTNARLAGLNIQGFGSTVDALNGNSLGRIWGASTLTVGNANGSGDYAGAIGVDFAGTTSATGLTKTGNGNQTISGRIAGSGNISVNAGKLLISGNNTSSGTTTINGGTLEVSGGSAISDTGAVTLANAAGVTFRLSSNETIGSLAGGNSTVGAVELQSNVLTVGGSNNSTTVGALISGAGGSIVKTGTGNLTLSNSGNSFNGGITISNGALIGTGTNGANAFGNNAIQLGDAGNNNVTLQLNSWNNLTANNTVNVVGAGSHTILGTHNNTGQTHILGGAITLNSNDLTIANSLAAGYRISGGVTGAGNLRFENNNSGGSGLNIDVRSALNNVGTVTNAGTGLYNLQINGTNGGSIGANVTSIIQNSSTSAFDLSAAINAGTAASVEVRAGSMLLNNANSLRVANSVAVGSGGTLDVRQSNTIAGLNNFSGAGGVVTNSSNSTNTVLTVGAASGNFSFGGNLTDGATNKLGLTKSGNSIQTLTGVNTYTGNTTVTAGTLVLSGSGSISNSPLLQVQSGAVLDASAVTGGFQLASGQTLQNKGTFTGSLTALSGSTYAPGNSPGIATQAGNLTLNTGSVFQWELVANTTTGAGTNFDQTQFTSGGLTIQSGVTADLVFNYAGSTVDWANTFWDASRSWTLFSGASSLSSVAGVFGTINVGLDSLGQTLSVSRGSFSFTTSGNDVLLAYTAVPEPGTWALAAFSLTALMVLRRRKQS